MSCTPEQNLASLCDLDRLPLSLRNLQFENIFKAASAAENRQRLPCPDRPVPDARTKALEEIASNPATQTDLFPWLYRKLLKKRCAGLKASTHQPGTQRGTHGMLDC